MFINCTLNNIFSFDRGALLTLMPSQRDTARSGLKALSVRMERNAGMSAAPAIMAPKFISESLTIVKCFLFVFVLCQEI